MIAYVLQTLYLLRRYRVMGAPLQRWIVLLLLLAAFFMAVGLLPGGLVVGLISLLLAIALLAGQRLAAGRQYVHFRPEPISQPMTAATPISPAGKLAIHATGLFEVEGKAQRFTELPAFYRSFSTREHAIMAVVQPARRLAGLARWPDEELGMWYIFVKHHELRQVQPGVLGFGRVRRPALRLLVEQMQPDKNAVLDAWGLQWGKDKSKLATRQQTLYLSFDGEAERARVLEDLLADRGG
ncbi:MAG: hypothetical protein IAE85_13175 [Anaerolinea sp.]|nr:hypothetical protein [Anaerolinea sp.]